MEDKTAGEATGRATSKTLRLHSTHVVTNSYMDKRIWWMVDE
jgi:hypothetical protein